MSQSLAALNLANITCSLTDPNDMPPPYHGIGISICFPVPRRFNWIERSTLSTVGADRLSGLYLNSSRSNPPPDFPLRYSNPFSGGRPPFEASLRRYTDLLFSPVFRKNGEPPRFSFVSQPRMLAMWLARKHTRAALTEISEFFGRRSHSTVVSAQNKVRSPDLGLSPVGGVRVESPCATVRF